MKQFCHQEKCSCGAKYPEAHLASCSVYAPSPHTEGVEDKTRELWNWVASNMTNPNDITSVRMAQKFGPEFREKIASILHQTREDTLALVEREVIGSDEESPYMSDKGIQTTDNSRMFRNGLRAEQRQRLKEGKV